MTNREKNSVAGRPSGGPSAPPEAPRRTAGGTTPGRRTAPRRTESPRTRPERPDRPRRPSPATIPLSPLRTFRRPAACRGPQPAAGSPRVPGHRAGCFRDPVHPSGGPVRSPRRRRHAHVARTAGAVFTGGPALALAALAHPGARPTPVRQPVGRADDTTLHPPPSNINRTFRASFGVLSGIIPV